MQVFWVGEPTGSDPRNMAGLGTGHEHQFSGTLGNFPGAKIPPENISEPSYLHPNRQYHGQGPGQLPDRHVILEAFTGSGLENEVDRKMPNLFHSGVHQRHLQCPSQLAQQDPVGPWRVAPFPGPIQTSDSLVQSAPDRSLHLFPQHQDHTFLFPVVTVHRWKS